MATNYELTWDGKARRWRFQLDKVRHVRSVRQLKKDSFLHPATPENKEASYQGAKAWQQAVLQKSHEARLPRNHARELARLKTIPTSEAVREAMEFVETDAASGDPLPDSLLRDMLPRTPIEAPLAPKFYTVGVAADEWIEVAVKSRERLGQIVHREVVNHRYGVRVFRTWIGDSTPLAEINEAKWVQFFAHLSKLVHEGRYKPTYLKHALRYTRDFLEWCSNIDIHPDLKNLRDRKMKIGISEPVKDYFTEVEIHKLLAKATGQTKLHILLALNCGFTQVDISDLHPDEVDFKRGRIKRKRSKGRKHTTVPVVDYPLWPETLELLREAARTSKDPQRVLTTHSGRPWVDKEGKDTDSIRTQFGYLQDDTGITKSFRSFRKTAANRLGQKPEFAGLQQYFLGHAPSSIAQRHYVDQAHQEIFDKAVAWLRGELIVSKKKGG